MSSSHGSKYILTGTSRVGYGSSEQIPEACLKAKSPQAPEQLTSPYLCVPAILLVYDQYKQAPIRSLGGVTTYKGKREPGSAGV